MKTVSDRLDAVVQMQQGYFSARQALHAGYSYRTHAYHVGTGAWVREMRGIFRLARYPLAPEGPYVLWSLWSCNRQGEPQGVFSHQTALSIHELSDVMPSRLHVTVPPGFRRAAPCPAVLALHRRVLAPADVESRQGYRVVRPLCAVAELLAEGSEDIGFLRQALREGLRRGLITRVAIGSHLQKRSLRAVLKGSER